MFKQTIDELADEYGVEKLDYDVLDESNRFPDGGATYNSVWNHRTYQENVLHHLNEFRYFDESFVPEEGLVFCEAELLFDDTSDMEKLKKEYLAKLARIESAFEADPTSIRLTYEKMSKLIRSFAYNATGIEVQKYTLYEIRLANMNALADLVEEYYEPEFDRISAGDARESLKKTKRMIAEWN